MKKIELLAPAGSFECLKAAVNYGADAVYVGGNQFSARAFANNFDAEAMKEAVEYCHLRNVRLFVTMNTLLNEFEIEKAVEMAKYYHSINVDALLIQDLGLYYRLVKECPQMELHASTQMHIHDIDGVRTARKLGFKRVVLARESTLSFIKEAAKEAIEIECFVHGAICVSYSGQCLLSSATKKRSANKGVCAQCCRLKYEAYDLETEQSLKTDTDYLLSPKDMCLINQVPKLIEAGVSCLKIEGRMKSAAYVGYVTKLYREAIDAYYLKESFDFTSEKEDNLKLLFNRGFTDTYLLNDKQNLFGNSRPNHLGIPLGVVLYVKNHQAYIRLDRPLAQFDGIRFLCEEDSGMIVNRLYRNGKLINSANKGEIVAVDVKAFIPKKTQVLKTLDPKLEQTILAYEPKYLPLNVQISILQGQPIVITAYCLDSTYTYLSDMIPQAALNKPLDEETVRRQFLKTKDTVYQLHNLEIKMDKVFLPVSQLNQLRRDFLHYLDTERLKKAEKTEISPDFALMKRPPITVADLYLTKTDFIIEPVIRDLKVKADKLVVTSVASLFAECEQKFAYYTLNISNSWSFEFLINIGFSAVCLSTELNELAITALVKAYKERNGQLLKPYIFAKGQRALMYLRRDPLKEYRQNDHSLALKDHDRLLELSKKDYHFELLENYSYEGSDLHAICNYLYL